jgi:CheY-like chemotaxis protein
MDGLEAVRAIRDECGSAHAKTPVVMLTANVVAGRKEMFLRGGADDFLEKPIGITKLDAMLKQWIPKEKQSDAPERAAYAATDAAFPSVEGLDVECGLVNAGGSAALYGSVLASFCRDLDEMIPQIENSAEAGDFKLYTTLVHGLKGAAAAIGANTAATLAKNLEAAGTEENAVLGNGGTGAFLAELSALRRNIRAVLADFAEDAKDGMRAELLPMEDLKKALRDMDIQKVNALLAECTIMPLDANMREAVLEIERRVLMFEYDEAIEAIDALLRKDGGDPATQPRD